MTTATTSTAELPDRIREASHWRVVIHPAEYQAERIPSRDECWRIVERTRVARFGWEYPFVAPEGANGQPVPLFSPGSGLIGHRDEGGRAQGSDWIAAWHDSKKEYWRLYQSGQFVHLFSCQEDDADVREAIEKEAYYNWRPPRQAPSGLTGYLFFRQAIHRFTAIFGFASRLMIAGALDGAPVVRIEMKQIKDRYLLFYDPFGVAKLPEYRAHDDILGREWRLALGDDPVKRAREAARWFFEGFGYRASETAVKLVQEDFLNNRWR